MKKVKRDELRPEYRREDLEKGVPIRILKESDFKELAKLSNEIA